MSAGLNHEDPGVTLLGDIRQVFDARGGERFFSQVLVDALVAMEGAWSEWRGKGNRQPRPLTQVRLADMLHDFDIAPTSIWPVPRSKVARAICVGSSRRRGPPTATRTMSDLRMTSGYSAAPDHRVPLCQPARRHKSEESIGYAMIRPAHATAPSHG